LIAASEPAATPAESTWRARAPVAVLALILLVAAGLRLWSLDTGLPYSYNLDERAHFVPHAVAMTGGDLNPGYFINPPALTYLFAAYLSLIHLGGVEEWFAKDPGAVFLAARVVAVAFGVGTVAATYAAGREWFGRTAGLVAAAIMAVAFLPVFYSRLALNDGPGILPCALALWSAAIVLRTGSRRALLAGGACVGVAASLKYSNGAIVVALVAAFCCRAPAAPCKRKRTACIGARAVRSPNGLLAPHPHPAHIRSIVPHRLCPAPRATRTALRRPTRRTSSWSSSASTSRS
jgi:4-amino-4-deoxy-L-arabinose transferase-like glycosyltransferase